MEKQIIKKVRERWSNIERKGDRYWELNIKIIDNKIKKLII